MKQGASDAIPIPSKLRTLHENSHLISKIAPKIRIIHIFSPRVIKTDEANFKELVQSLTGQRACCKASSSSSNSSISNKNTATCQHKAASRTVHGPQPKKMVQVKGRSTLQASNHQRGVWDESNIRVVTPLSRKIVSISDMVQVKGGFSVSQNDEKVKKEILEETCKGENSNNGFSMGTGFSDMVGLFQDPSEFPSLFSKYSQFNVFGGMPMPWSLS